MDIWSSAVFSLFVIASAAGLLWWHVHSWKRHQHDAVTPRDLDYHRRQFRRRMQTSAMLAILGLGIMIGRLLMLLPGAAMFITIYWCGVLALLGWIALLALADVWATRQHFGALRTDFLVEQAKMKAELRRIQGGRRNGQTDGTLHGD